MDLSDGTNAGFIISYWSVQTKHLGKMLAEACPLLTPHARSVQQARHVAFVVRRLPSRSAHLAH